MIISDNLKNAFSRGVDGFYKMTTAAVVISAIVFFIFSCLSNFDLSQTLEMIKNPDVLQALAVTGGLLIALWISYIVVGSKKRRQQVMDENSQELQRRMTSAQAAITAAKTAAETEKTAAVTAAQSAQRSAETTLRETQTELRNKEADRSALATKQRELVEQLGVKDVTIMQTQGHLDTARQDLQAAEESLVAKSTENAQLQSTIQDLRAQLEASKSKAATPPLPQPTSRSCGGTPQPTTLAPRSENSRGCW